MNRLEIKKEEDRLTVAQILVANGYAVRKVVDGHHERGIKTTFLEYWRGRDEGKENNYWIGERNEI